VRVAFEALLVLLVFATRELDQPIAEAPALKLAAVAVAVAQDFSTTLDQLHCILVDAPKHKAAPMCDERQPEPQIDLPAAGLAP
jgi:hypothetical protein